MARKHDIALCLISHYVIGIRRDAIEAIRSGVASCIPNIHQVNLDGFSDLLSCQPTTASELKELVEDSIQELRNESRSMAHQRTVTFISRLFGDMSELAVTLLSFIAIVHII